ncbi:hypothetical protein MOBT1_002345 [Malassezia obtusa]|uniref:Uncharacterized protein n=1 Tax=Malassezia obtusa TaxID=76774 RepID=A0AAF0E1Z1_9BASI|nr:hypothetical protein MOBT1_002345 [Malassezia obtusa]
MSEAFPNPYDPPAEREEPRPSHDESEEDELNRAIRESLAFEAQSKERELREEDEALQAALAASRDEETRRRAQEQHNLLQERLAMEQSRQEARRREAEHQRQALLEMEILEQSRREHEAAMRFRQSMTPPRQSVVDQSAEESLLWLGARNSGGSTPRLGAMTPPPVASSSGRPLGRTEPRSPPSYAPRDGPHYMPNPFEASATPTAPAAPSRQPSLPNPYDAPDAARAPPTGAGVERQPSLPNPYEPPAPAEPAERAPAPESGALRADADEASSTSSITASESESELPPTLPAPPPSRYEAALAAAQAEYENESEDSWADESVGEEQLWRVPARAAAPDDEEEEANEAVHTAYDEAIARSDAHESRGAGTLLPEREDQATPQGVRGDEAPRAPSAPMIPFSPLRPRRQASDTQPVRAPPAPPSPTTVAPLQMDAPAEAREEPAPAYALDDQPFSARDPYDERAAAPTSLDRSSSRASSERRPSVFGEPYPPENASGQPALRGVQFGFADTPYALELYATPSAPAPLYARPELSLDPQIPHEGAASSEERLQLFFPEHVVLRTQSERPWFVVRAYSWKVLLQALAWYGHSTLGAEAPGMRLQPEIVFCMPRRLDQPHNAVPTFVSLAMGLAVPAPRLGSTQALETYAARLGAQISTASLAQHTLALPTDLVTFAQTLFSAPQLSSAPALRELRQAIARHDEWLDTRRSELAQRQRMHPKDAGGPVDRAESLEWSMLHHQLSLQQHPGALPAEAPADVPTGHREHFRQRVKKKLARWGGHAPDQDLSAWITPYDLSQHGPPASDAHASPIPR